jgi:signal transduction histidine kinase
MRNKVLKPFYQLSEVPFELSKGNLSIPLQENKDKLFGRFIWGMDLLRENLEENRTKELELQREKKMLLLSLSHDIKTPLSAIKLYAKALSRNLYKDEAKKLEIAGNIDEKVDEIEGYISDIVKASNEDFLHFEVDNGEFYIKDVLEQVREYYQDKMQLNQIAFDMGPYSNCLVYGDQDRLVEVLQNIIENAIKYGDGKHIWLDMQREEEEYIIRIFNTGCQLEDKELPHIFDSFFRGSNIDKKPGSGLGLYICRQLMHLMEGEITASVIEEDDNCEQNSNMKTMLVQVAIRLV